MKSNAARAPWRSYGPASVTAIVVLAAVVLALAPGGWIAPARKLVHEALRPGQRGIVAFRSQAGTLVARIEPIRADAKRLARAEIKLHALLEENQRLRRAMAALDAAHERQEQSKPTGVLTTEPLMRLSLIETRVLGHTARAYLERRGILEAGRSDGIESGDLVIDPAIAVVDSGRDMGVDSGDYVLAGRRIWGKIVQVGPHTGTVRRVNAPGYRDLVQLAHKDHDGLKLGPRGIVEGTGSRLCRVRFVEASEPISVGDLVYATLDDGKLDGSLLYGTVVRVQRPTEAAHWEVWMQPAASRPLPSRLAVLKSVGNPRRLGDGADLVGVARPQVRAARHVVDANQKR